MVWTPLHATLGAADSELTYALIQEACEQHIAERTQLDWKRQLPLTASEEEGRRHEQLELAKDFAAMANSGGGLIVYGVEETRGTEDPTADKILSVGEVTDTTLRATDRHHSQ